MKEKVVIVSMPMRADAKKCSYKDLNLDITSDFKTTFPIISVIAENDDGDTSYRFLLVIRKTGFDSSEENVEKFKEELENIVPGVYKRSVITCIEAPLTPDFKPNEKLTSDIIDAIPDYGELVADITYGSKDTFAVIFCVLEFAKKHLCCKISGIFYGMVFFEQGQQITESYLCDFLPVYSTHSIVNIAKGDNPEASRKLLKTLMER